MALSPTMPPTEVLAARGHAAWRPAHLVWAVVGVAVIARLPFLTVSAGPDEAGFLQVAHQWSPGGGSLYGHYWVDRPPLLITIYALADLAGGLVPLRLVGCVAVGATIFLTAGAARRLAGDRAATWAAVVTAALLASPLVGSEEVNGELLSAPFVAAGLWALVEAARACDPRRVLLLSGLGGAAGLCALMVKQNIVDVFVFGTVLVLAGAWSRRAPIPEPRRLLAGVAAGTALALAVITAWTMAHGTSMLGVLYAMYPFRLHAAQVVAAGGNRYAAARGLLLAHTWVTSGMVLLTVALLTGSVRYRLRSPAVLALAAVLTYDGLSIALGGGFWLHYLVEMVVPVAVWTGVLAARAWSASRLAAALVAVLAAVAVATSAFQQGTSSAQRIGDSVARVAQRGDTLTTLYGEAQINLASGLPSPYPYLWSLPVKTLDPHLTDLDGVLSSPRAPTWVVVSRSVSSWGLDTARTQALISTGYHPVAVIAGQTIYLRDGVVRAVPSPDAHNPFSSQDQP